MAAAVLALSAGAGYLGAAHLDRSDDPPPEVAAAPRPAPRASPAPDPAPSGAPAAPAGPVTAPVEPPRPPAKPDPASRDELVAGPDPPPPSPAAAVSPAIRAPAPPPRTFRIAPGDAPSGHLAARRVLGERLARARPGSRAAADLRHSLALARRYLAPEGGVPEGRRRTVARALRTAAWWYARWPAPSGRVLVRDADGIIHTYRPGHGFAVNPVATTGRWRGLNAELAAERLAEPLLEMGVARAAPGRRFLAWEYYDVADAPGAIVPGASAMAQARVALLMAHAWRRTGDPRFAAASRDALAAFTVDVDRGGVLSRVRGPADPLPGPWYVERAYPGADPWKGGALNGFMVSLLNLRGAAATLGGSAATRSTARLARRLADRGAESLVRFLPLHDSGSWSLYGLVTPGRPPGRYLADGAYHCYHVRLLRALAGAYPRAGFAVTAERWQGYAATAGVGCRTGPRA